MHAVQRLYGSARPVEIRYEIDGQFVTASAALIGGDTTRQRIRYESGLTLWVNGRPAPWNIETSRSVGGEGAGVRNRTSRTSARPFVLPQWGFLALGPNIEVWTALHNGRIADYAECPEYVFTDRAPPAFPDKGGALPRHRYAWLRIGLTRTA